MSFEEKLKSFETNLADAQKRIRLAEKAIRIAEGLNRDVSDKKKRLEELKLEVSRTQNLIKTELATPDE